MLARKQLGLKHSSAVAQCKSLLVGKQKKAEEKENGGQKIVLGRLSCKKERENSPVTLR